jgi:hypothetical protein
MIVPVAIKGVGTICVVVEPLPTNNYDLAGEKMDHTPLKP